ncbi:hypothetical protein ABFG93_21710 (plasmid) [Pseudalkalibacillus hwajinpoensis]|uniref:hypothetical protein n=1 Tax=Guptibacillus hwajinpoensis TaxID=208199 RepID=UPI00325AB68D
MQNENSWREDLVKISDAKQWIISNIPGVKSVEGPVEVFRSNDWGMTASFEIKKTSESMEVVLKVGFLPLFKTSPSIYRTLERLNSEHVVSFLTGEVKTSQTWLLFEKFEGKQVRELDNVDLIHEMAVTMARLQVDFLNLSDPVKKDIPVYDYQQLKGVLEEYISQAVEEFAPVWNSEALQLNEKFNLSVEHLKAISNPENLENMIEVTHEICDELAQMGAPLSIYHIDFHTNNASLTEQEEILLYDFEEAVISHPFFVLDKLLDEVSDRDEKTNLENLDIQWTPAQRELRDTYLKEFDDIDEPLKLKMFDLAMMVSPLLYGYLGTFFLKQVGWEKSTPGYMAESFIAAFSRMKSYKSTL